MGQQHLNRQQPAHNVKVEVSGGGESEEMVARIPVVR